MGQTVETSLDVQVANVARLTELTKPAQISNSVVMPKASYASKLSKVIKIRERYNTSLNVSTGLNSQTNQNWPD